MATTWNPSDKHANAVLSNGNLSLTTSSTSWAGARATTSKAAGKWYFEVVCDSMSSVSVGIGTINADFSYVGNTASAGGVLSNGGEVFFTGGSPSYGDPVWSAGDIIGVAVDMDATSVVCYRNNTQIASNDFDPSRSPIFPMVSCVNSDGAGGAATGRFTADAFTYSPPSGYSAWDTGITTVNCDTLRSLVSAVSVPADTSRVLSGPVSIGCDTSRLLTAAVSVNADTLRSLSRVESVAVDTLRSLIQTVSAPIDTRRRIVGPLSSIKQLTIDLRAQVLGDSFTLDAYTAPAIKTPYGGTLYGWPWQFVVRSKQYVPATRKYSWAGDYDIADLLKKYVVFTRVLFDSDDIMSAIAGRLGKSLVIAADKHSINPLASTTKIMDAISSLYSWTSSIPHQLVNVFLRGDVLYVLQRGKETASYAPVKYNIVSLEESQMDTLMDQKTGTPKITGEALTINSSGEEIYVNGTWSGGGSSVTFENGLNVRTVTISGTQTTETNSSYDSAKYITHKSIDVTDSANSAADTTTNTSYSYDPWDGQPYLSGEYTTVYKGSTLQSTTETNYSPLGFNFFGCTQSTYNSAGKRTGFSSYVSEGRPGGPASPYTRGRAAVGNTVPESVDVARNPLSPSSIPATDLATVTRYKNGLEWLDGRTQYVLNIECWDDHVMDYTETIIINGLTWYLNSNQIVITGDQPKAKQTANLVRWA